jgi:hypothetical protein
MPVSFRLMIAIRNSYSKSEYARKPRTKKSAVIVNRNTQEVRGVAGTNRSRNGNRLQTGIQFPRTIHRLGAVHNQPVETIHVYSIKV